MKRRVHPATGVLVIVIALLIIAMVYRQRFEEVAPAPQATIVSAPQGPPMDEPALGIAWMPEMDTHEIRVVRLLAGPPPSRLALLGVKPGDVLKELDGGKCDLGEMRTALDKLQEKGTPFTLTVLRGGQIVKLEAKKLPEALKSYDFGAPSDVSSPPARGGRGRRGR